jgi:hypothetical protein
MIGQVIGSILLVGLVGLLFYVSVKEKRRARRARWQPPTQPGVRQLRRPFDMPQARWDAILTEWSKAGWHVVASNPLINQVTLETK